MPVPTKTLVTGATGSIGRVLVERLERGTHDFTVLCRRRDQAHAFGERGIDAVLGDFDDPASIRSALDGCDQLFLLPPGGSAPGDQYRRDVHAIDAAKTAGVRQVVKISASDANSRSSVPWARDHGRSDEYLTSSGLAWTRLHPPAFMTNLFAMAPLVRRGLLPNPSGHGACTWVDPADLAAAAYVILTDETRQGGAGKVGRRYLLTGTQPLSFPQIAVILTAALGHTVTCPRPGAPAIRRHPSRRRPTLASPRHGRPVPRRRPTRARRRPGVLHRPDDTDQPRPGRHGRLPRSERGKVPLTDNHHSG